jgi:hypothetical protein
MEILGFISNQRSDTKNMKTQVTTMVMVGCALSHPGGTYEFDNPNTCEIITSNSVKWKNFNRWEESNVDSTAGKLLNHGKKNESIDESESE